MVTEVEMTVWIQSVWSCETVKDQIVDEAHGRRQTTSYGSRGTCNAIATFG